MQITVRNYPCRANSGCGPIVPCGEVLPVKIHYLIAFRHQSITGRPALEEILYPPLTPLAGGFVERFNLIPTESRGDGRVKS